LATNKEGEDNCFAVPWEEERVAYASPGEAVGRDEGVISVVTRRLDSVFSEANGTEVDMIKIDVEGAELEVLKGAGETLSRNSDGAVLVDLHPDLGVSVFDVVEILQGLDFRIYRMQPPFNIPARAGKDVNEILTYRGKPRGTIPSGTRRPTCCQINSSGQRQRLHKIGGTISYDPQHCR
jgi:methyltransferase FkbM-like protein